MAITGQQPVLRAPRIGTLISTLSVVVEKTWVTNGQYQGFSR